MDAPPEPETVDTPSEGPPGPVAAPEEGTPNTDVAPPEPPKRKGRPPGSKDTVKRTRRPPVQVRIEPLEAVAAAPKSAPKPPVAVVPEPVRPEPVVEVAPASPRTQYREHTQHLIRLRNELHENKRSAHAQMYVSRWSQWPVV